MLGENEWTSNVRTSVFVHSRYLSLCASRYSSLCASRYLSSCAKYILSPYKFAESTNIGENIGEYCSENQFPQLFVNLCENARECRRTFGIRLFSENWRMCGSGFNMNKSAIIAYLLDIHKKSEAITWSSRSHSQKLIRIAMFMKVISNKSTIITRLSCSLHKIREN